MKIFAISLFPIWALIACNPIQETTKESDYDLSLNQYVDPFIGTSGYGNVYPGSQIPFGGIQLSPDTDMDFYDA